ncbi:MAG: hypothetical protein GOVbin3107_16 [Prokaryotic dsDNA virus sp.]|mgnify:CR=1 FL=1|nr:MAG: hypothetical protein GOVbin3107_16 [Prokaryotic dsDNA virus sp.]|tara:strand:+ start:1404 stop:1928 length:525 start_codon:yes stop_codon:yes gene_type:complete
MEKFLNVQVQDFIVSGTSITAGGVNYLTDNGGEFANVASGDIIHQTTNNQFYLVDQKVDNNNVTITAITLFAPASIASGKAYSVYSATEFNHQMISVSNVALIEQAVANQTVLKFDDVAAVDTLTIVHTDVPLLSEYVRDLVEDEMVKAYQTHWKDVLHTIDTTPYFVTNITIA